MSNKKGTTKKITSNSPAPVDFFTDAPPPPTLEQTAKVVAVGDAEAEEEEKEGEVEVIDHPIILHDQLALVPTAAGAAVAGDDGAASKKRPLRVRLRPYHNAAITFLERTFCTSCQVPFSALKEADLLRCKPYFCRDCGRSNCGRVCDHATCDRELCPGGDDHRSCAREWCCGADAAQHRKRECKILRFGNVYQWPVDLFRSPADWAAIWQQQEDDAAKTDNEVETLRALPISELLDPLTVALSLWIAARHIPLLNDDVKQGIIHSLRLRGWYAQLMQTSWMKPQPKPAAVEVSENPEEQEAKEAAAEAEWQTLKELNLTGRTAEYRPSLTLDALGENILLHLYGAMLMDAFSSGDVMAQLFHAYYQYFDWLTLVYQNRAGVLDDVREDARQKGKKLEWNAKKKAQLQRAYQFLVLDLTQERDRYTHGFYVEPENCARGFIQQYLQLDLEKAYKDKEHPINSLWHITLIHADKDEAQATLHVGPYAIAADLLAQHTGTKKDTDLDDAMSQTSCAVCGVRDKALFTCRTCHSVSYCGPTCQRLDWRKKHRALCADAAAKREAAQRIAQAKQEEEAAAAAAAGGSDAAAAIPPAASPQTEKPFINLGKRPASTQILLRVYGDPKDPHLQVIQMHTTLYSLRDWLSGCIVSEATQKQANTKMLWQVEEAMLRKNQPAGSKKGPSQEEIVACKNAFDVMQYDDPRLATLPDKAGFFAAQRVQYLTPNPYWARQDLHGFGTLMEFGGLLDQLCASSVKPKDRGDTLTDVTGVKRPKDPQPFSAVMMHTNLNA